MKNRILITGGAGFIGSNLVKYLLLKKKLVNVLDNLSNGTRKNLPKNINFFRGDIRSLKDLEKSSKDCNVIIHLAAKSALQETISNPVDCISNNISGTVNIINLCIKNKIKLIFASTCAVYPINSNKKSKEIDHGSYETPYAISKISCENLINFYIKQNKINSCILRFFNVYGIGQNPNSIYSAVVPKFIKQSKNNKNLTIFNSGKQQRDFININDVCEAIFKSINYKYSETFNIGTGETTSIEKLAKIIIKLNKKGKLKKSKKIEFDAFFSCADMYKTHKKLKFKAKINITEGIKNQLQNEI